MLNYIVFIGIRWSATMLLFDAAVGLSQVTLLYACLLCVYRYKVVCDHAIVCHLQCACHLSHMLYARLICVYGYKVV